MGHEMSPEGMKAWRAFLEAHSSVVRKLERELREERDMPISWYDALVQLDEAGGVLRMHELAERMLLSRSATTRFADRLERAGLIERRQSADDRRGTEVLLTPAGRGRLREAAPVHLRGVARHFADHLSDREAAELEAILRKVASAE
jgi:DNA-binding MarR family transcriptional regulator